MENKVTSRTKRPISRRTFAQASALAVSALALVGCSDNKLKETDKTDEAATIGSEEGGEWKAAACYFNCGGRCPNYAYIKDNTVVRQKADDTHEDGVDYPQQRACLRGRSIQKVVFGDERIKYPMKRKHWEPGGGDRQLRGRDEWERISWDEALSYVADELMKAKEQYGNRSILHAGFGTGHSIFSETLSHFGGFVNIVDSASFGTFQYFSTPVGLPPYGIGGSNNRFDLRNSETIVFYGCNPTWASLGTSTYRLWPAKERGAQFVTVGPDYSNTAALFDAKWIRVRPGTDIAFLLAVAYVMITEDEGGNQLIDWDFIDRCTVGFDAEHMPEEAKENENFKDYVLGSYDGIPKTPEWASPISGTPTEDIEWYAKAIGKDVKAAILYSMAPARCNDAEDFPQLLMTISAMGGHFGKSGHLCGSCYHAYAGDDGAVLNVLGATDFPFAPNPVTDYIDAPHLWNAIIDGKYPPSSVSLGKPFAFQGEKEIDIHVICNHWRNTLQTIVGVDRAIEAYRNVDFVFTLAAQFDPTAQFADIILPLTTHWEMTSEFNNQGMTHSEVLVFPSKVVEPLFEAKTDQQIGYKLAEKLGLDPDVVYPISVEQQAFNRIANSLTVQEDGTGKTRREMDISEKAGDGMRPVASITEDDIAWFSEKYGPVTREPQEGAVPLKQLMEKGFYQVERFEGDPYGTIAYEEFRKDPAGHPLLTTTSGKFEIYCQKKADTVDAMGTGTLKGYPTYRPAKSGYEEAQTGDYPYQAFNPHYLRRSHTVFDNNPWLREAAINPVFISAADAAEKGISDGDAVLITGKSGKSLRHATVSERMMPGVVSLPHGAWLRIEDDETMIDTAGCDNYLHPEETSMSGVSGYNTCLVDIEKYSGENLPADMSNAPRVPEAK